MKSYHDFIIIFLYLYIYGIFLGVLSCTIRKPPRHWAAGIFPNPRQDVGSCGRNCTKSWVCDPTNILSTPQANELDSIIDTIAISGICPCSNCSGQEGYLVFVFLTPRIQKVQGLSNEESASLIVSNLNAQWGKETSCGNSVVILISKEDKEVYTGVGPAASSVLTEHLIKTVNNDVKPLLTDGDYFSALVKILQSYNSTFHSNTLDILVPIPAKSSGSNSARDSFMTFLPVVIIIFAIGVIAICLCKLCGKKSSANTKTRNSRRKGGRSALNKHSVPSVAYSKSHGFPSFGHASLFFSGGGFFGGGCDNSVGVGGDCGGGSSDCGGGGGGGGCD